MLKNNKKILITIALFVALLAGAAIVTFSLAGKGILDSVNPIASKEMNAEAGLDRDAFYISNIDLIISDANESDYMYRIVNIIPSSATGSRPIESYTKDFKEKVLEANSDNKAKMPDGKINIITLVLDNKVEASTLVNSLGSKMRQTNAETFGAKDTVETMLANTDLLYIESPKKNSYTGRSGMTTSIYNYLRDYYTGVNHKPIIVDTLTNASEETEVQKTTYKTFINEVKGRYIYSPVFGWPEGQSAKDFFEGKGQSRYLQKSLPTDSADGKATGQVLVLVGGATAASGDFIHTNFTKDNIPNIYTGKKQYYPDDFNYTYVNVSALTADSDLSTWENYEFIIIEASAMGVELLDNIHTKLTEIANGTQYMIYDGSFEEESAGNGTKNNYELLLKSLLTDKNVARAYYVLPVSNGFFADEAKTTKGANKIADLINSSNYRGSETNGRNGKKFRVLELQPCYPIDLDIAESKADMSDSMNAEYGVKGNYYTEQVINLAESGLTKDDIYLNGAKNADEYYAFELSKAKIAHITKLNVNQIEIDQMSTDEFISKKDVVLDTYDLVYIGGNTSALMPSSLAPGFNIRSTDAFQILWSNRFFTCFDMYTHTGRVYQLNTGGDGTVPYGQIDGVQTGTVANGNDISYLKLQELINYVDAGMPIIFSNAVSEVFDKVYDKSRLEQLSAHDLDPDSNMFALLSYVKELESPTNVYWNMDIAETKVKNTDNKYGSSDLKKVTVFNSASETKMLDVINASNARPTVQITSAPADYELNNIATYNVIESDGAMVIKAKVAGEKQKYNLTLYVDENGDGTFSEDEIKSSGVYDSTNGEAAEVSLTYKFTQDDFYGLVSWKVVASVAESDAEIPVESGEESDEETIIVPSSKTPHDAKYGYAYYKRPEKKELNVLQILPFENTKKNVYSNNAASLYLCTECQLYAGIAEYNLYNENNYGSFYTHTESDQATINNISLGLHEHKFGIVNYDPVGKKYEKDDMDGSDDWTYNLADEFKDDYDCDVDILPINKYHEYAAIVEANGKTGEETTLGDSSISGYNDRLTEEGLKVDGSKVVLDGQTTDYSTMTWVDYYTVKADKYYEEYQAAKEELVKSSAKSGLDKILEDLMEQVGESGVAGRIGYSTDKITVDAEFVQTWIDHQAYYNYFLYYAGYNENTAPDKAEFIQFVNQYNNWSKLHDKVVQKKELYRKYSCYANTSDTWLYNNYDMVVLGFADEFGQKDLTVPECNQIRSFVQTMGGSLLLTHDTTTRSANSGSVNLTTELRDVFGIDRYHATLKKDSIASATVTKLNGYFYISDPKGDSKTYYGPIRSNGKKVHFNLVLAGADDEGETMGSYTVYPVKDVTESTDIDSRSCDLSYTVYESEADYEANTPTSTDYDWKMKLSYPTNGLLQEANQVGTATSTGNYNVTWQIYSGQTVSYVMTPEYEFAGNEDGKKYFMTQVAVIDPNELEDRVSWQYNLNNILNMGWNSAGVINLVGVTDSVAMFRSGKGSSAQAINPYKYAEWDWIDVAINGKAYGPQSKPSQLYGTNHASQVNSGIITIYPFATGNELNISPTHPQTYAVDLEDSNMVVWYTLSQTTREVPGKNQKTIGSLYAATPHDSMDNYFLYTYRSGKGTVNYTGAGHSYVTGYGKMNWDERRLYMNLAVDSVRNKGSRPKVVVKTKDNKEVTEETKGVKLDKNGNYVYTVDDTAKIPEFNFDVKFNQLTTLSDVYVFYDLNYDSVNGDYSNKYTDDENHVLIHHYEGPIKDGYEDASNSVAVEKSKMKAKLREKGFTATNSWTEGQGESAVAKTENYDALKLNAKRDGSGSFVDYFANYGGSYTYIVIWAKDSNGKTAYARIKIRLVQELFDLTDATITNKQQYFTTYTFMMDVTDKHKYNF